MNRERAKELLPIIKPERRKVWVVFYQNDWIPLAFNTRGYADAEVERVGKLGIRCKVVCVEEPE